MIQNLLLPLNVSVKQYTGEAASQALLCQPSSAAAEQVFSVMTLNSCFGDGQQLSSLYRGLSV